MSASTLADEAVAGPTVISYNLDAAAALVGVSEGLLRREIHARRLKAKRSALDENGDPTGKYLIEHQSLREWFDSLPDA